MHELLQFLNRKGVNTFLTVAQHGLVGDMKAPVDVTYLADTVLLLRYFEAVGEVRRAVSVIKKRAGSHEKTIREYQDRGERFGGRAAAHGLSGGPARCAELRGPWRRPVGRAQRMTLPSPASSVRTLVLAPMGANAQIAAKILGEAGIEATVCCDLSHLIGELRREAGLALIVEEVLHDQDYGGLSRWVETQPAWSDFPIVILAQRGGGLERNPAAGRFSQVLGNVVFLERPFHPTTLVSVVQTALRGRRRQYEARERLETLRAAVARQQKDQTHLRLLINELNHRVKNTLATVQSIVTQTLRSGGAPLATRDTLTSRIVALSKAHDVLTDEQWSGADLAQIAAQAAQPFRMGLGEARIALQGPPVRVPPKTAIAVALRAPRTGDERREVWGALDPLRVGSTLPGTWRMAGMSPTS